MSRNLAKDIPRSNSRPGAVQESLRPSREEMARIVASLSDRERAILRDPDFMTEEEADIIMVMRAEREPGKSSTLKEVLRENGLED